MKRIFAIILAALLLAAVFAGCKKKPADPKAGTATTAQAGETVIPPGGAVSPDGAAAGEEDERPEAPGQKTYSSPKRIPTVKQGKDYTNGGIPDGVASIFSMDGKLLFTYVTRMIGSDQTKDTRDFYTLFEYHPESGKCTAVSPEVGYITRVGDRFLYDKAGVGIGAANYWDVPYYTNNISWTDEKQITGAEARKLISASETALIKGKVQPYTTQRMGAAVTVTLPESGENGEVLAINLDFRGAFGKNAPDGLMIDIRGIANERLYISVGSISDAGEFVKELFSVPVGGGAPVPIRHDGLPIWVDPISGIQDGVIYGYSVLPNKNRALVRVDTGKDTVRLLATVRDGVWHCIANDKYVLYEVPKASGKSVLECKPIAAQAAAPVVTAAATAQTTPATVE